MERTPEAAALLAPVDAVLDPALQALGSAPSRVTVGPVEGAAYRLDDDVLVLSDALLGPEPVAAIEPPGPHALDRWRRAAASVLEAATLVGLPAGPAWLRLGWAIHRADAVAPMLRLATPDLAASGAGDLSAAPRGGVAVLAAWAAQGHDVAARVGEALAAGTVPAAWWIEAARWILGEGLVTRVPDAHRAPAQDVPLRLGPWSFARLEVPAHARGGRLRVRGGGGVAPAWAAADTVLEGVAGALGEGCRIDPESGGPVGTWELKTAEGFGRVFGARGMTYRFAASGQVEVTLADAFVGSIEDVEAAEQVGTSGVAMGRWRVAGPHRITLHDVVPQGVTLHGRGDEVFAMPADGFGLAAALRALEEGTWTWRMDGERLVLSGRMFGGPVEIRLAPAQTSFDA